MNGWIKLHRSLLENVELMHDPTSRLLFVDLLLLSNSKGEVGKSGRDLAKKLEIPHSTIYKSLKRLESYGVISVSNRGRYTYIHILNWNKYQGNNPPLGKQFGKQFLTEGKQLSGKQPRKQTGNTGETDGKQITGVARIENKNKNSGSPDLEGSGYRKAFKEYMKLKTKSV